MGNPPRNRHEKRTSSATSHQRKDVLQNRSWTMSFETMVGAFGAKSASLDQIRHGSLQGNLPRLWLHAKSAKIENSTIRGDFLKKSTRFSVSLAIRSALDLTRPADLIYGLNRSKVVSVKVTSSRKQLISMHTRGASLAMPATLKGEKFR